MTNIQIVSNRASIILLSVFFLSIFSGSLFAETRGKIAGKVVNKQTGEGLMGANVIVQGTSSGATTNEQGEYYIINITAGSYTVKATYLGFESMIVKDVEVFINRTTRLDFQLKETTIAGSAVTIIAEKPIIVKDLTASERVIDSESIENTWARSFEEVIEMQPGIFQGHFRGGHLLESVYMIDNVSLNSGLLSDNYTGINTSTIQSVSVLTGGYNAEYGNAQSGIVNIVTKESFDRIHGTVVTRMRPAGKYHWGPNMYSSDLYDVTNFNLEYWTGLSQNPNSEFYGADPNQLLEQYRNQITPDPTQSKYAERAEYETEATLYGPLTNKLGFLLSGRFKRGVNIFPQMEKYNPEYNFQTKLNYKLNDAIKLTVNGLLGGYTTSGVGPTHFNSIELSQEMAWNGLPQLTNPYQWNKYAMVGSWVGFPEQRKVSQISFKWTHMLNPKTFYELDLSYLNDYIDKTDRMEAVPKDKWAEDDDVYDMTGHFLVQGYSHWEDKMNSSVYTLRGDITSQVNMTNQIKAGLMFKAYDFYYDHYMPGLEGGTRWNLINIYEGKPYEGVGYVQDKIEFSGLIVNAGLRVDFFNQNRDAPKYMFDPLAQLETTPGNEIPGIPGDPERESTELQVALAPRLGISHPISDNTVLHFVYGHFYQRPSWHKMFGLPVCIWSTDPDSSRNPWLQYGWIAEWQGFLGNPKLDYERTVQYEIGIDQNISDILHLDITAYYKDASKQTVFREGNMYNPRYGVQNTWTWLMASNMGTIMVSNCAYVDIRGLEMQLDTRFDWLINFSLSYDLSYATGGVAGYDNLFGPGISGVNATKGYGQNEKPWDKNHKLKGMVNLNLPKGYGPAIAGIKPLSDINLNVYSEYWNGQEYTYHGPGDTSTEPNNKRWKPHYRTNLKFAKGISISGLRSEFSIEVRNVFNNKDLNLLGGDNLTYYMENPDLPEKERLPKHSWSGEPNEWGWYNIWTNPPRQIYLQFKVDF